MDDLEMWKARAIELDAKLSEAEHAARTMRATAVSAAQTAERACERLTRYQPVIDAARALVYAAAKGCDSALAAELGGALAQTIFDLDSVAQS